MTTHTLEWRLKRHAECIRYPSKKRGYLQDAICKYGMSAMKAEVVAVIPRAALAAAEMEAIATHNTRWPNGLNMSDGGDGGSRMIANSEIARIRNMKATMATREYKRKQVEIQKAVWTEERKAERAESIREMWKDPEYRARQVKAHLKPRQATLNLVLSEQDKHERRIRLWDDEKKQAARERNIQRCADPAVRQRIADVQRKVMQERPELRMQIALAMSRYKGHSFRKAVVVPNARKPSVITRTWMFLPEIVTTADLYAIEWRSREIDRAIHRGWLEVHSLDEGAGLGYGACCPSNIVYGVPAQKAL